MLQEDLIGAGTERRGDERKRAALHAEWAAGRDEDEIKELLEGVKGGFRKRRRGGALADEVRLSVGAVWGVRGLQIEGNGGRLNDMVCHVQGRRLRALHSRGLAAFLAAGADTVRRGNATRPHSQHMRMLTSWLVGGLY